MGICFNLPTNLEVEESGTGKVPGLHVGSAFLLIDFPYSSVRLSSSREIDNTFFFFYKSDRISSMLYHDISSMAIVSIPIRWYLNHNWRAMNLRSE